MTSLELLEKIHHEQHDGIEPNQEEMLNRYINRLLKTSEFTLTEEKQFAMIEKYKSIAQSLPTKYQDISSYYILMERFMGLEAVLNSKDFAFYNGIKTNVKKIPVFGTIKMAQFNAFVTPTQDRSDALVVFSESLISFAGIISKCVSLAFPIELGESDMVYFDTGVKQIEENIKNDTISIAHFLDLMFSYMLTNEPIYAKMFYTGPHHAPMASILCRGFETFIAGHEYAHHVLEHLGVNNIADLENIESRRKEPYSQEIDADALGIELALQRMVLDGNDQELSLAGIYLGLKSIDLLNRINNIRLNRDEGYYFSASHPSPLVRQEAFIEQTYKNSGNNDELFKSTVSVDFIIEHMWGEFKVLLGFFNKTLGDNFWDMNDVEGNLQKIKKVIYEKY